MIQAHKLVRDSSIKQESVIEVQTPNLAFSIYKEPFYDWKHGIQRFKRHASSAIHKNANVDLMHFKNIKIYHKDVPVNQQLNKLKK